MTERENQQSQQDIGAPSSTERGLGAPVYWLMAAQALYVASNMCIVAFAGLAGHLVADNPALATLPVTAILFSNALTTAPLSLFMGRYGRTAGFALGGVSGCLGGLLAAYGVYHLDFVYLVLGMLLSGPFMASAQY